MWAPEIPDADEEVEQTITDAFVLEFFFMGQFGWFSAPELKNGDIVFQESQSSQSRASSAGTKSPITHMGIIYIHWTMKFPASQI